MDTENKKFMYGTAGILIALFILGYVFIPKIVTNNRLERAAKIARTQDLQTGYCFKDIRDWWGTEICITRKVAEGNLAVHYTATSAGKDVSFETIDDLFTMVTDLNKSKLIGMWAGKRAKEAAKGLREGIFTKSKFDDPVGKKNVGEPDKSEDKKFNWKFWKKDN